MEATIKITNGKKTKFVTEFVAKDSAFMNRFGFWRDGEVKTQTKLQSAIDTLSKDLPTFELSADVDLLAAKTEVIEETKAQVVEKLKAAGIKFNPNDKKEVLQSLLKEGK